MRFHGNLHRVGGDYAKPAIRGSFHTFSPLWEVPHPPSFRRVLMIKPVIMKFGGTSLADPVRIRLSASIIRSEARKNPAIVILSAMAGITDQLLLAGTLAVNGNLHSCERELALFYSRHEEAAHELLDEKNIDIFLFWLKKAFDECSLVCRGASLLGDLPLKSQAQLLSQGELLSSRLMAVYLGARWLDARSVIRTGQVHSRTGPLLGEINRACSEKLRPTLLEHGLVISQGFIASDKKGNTTLLGRGGSDYSASLFAVGMGAREVQIWTDVDGVLNADPRLVPDAKPLEHLSYDEATELAAFGAKVLHPATMAPAIEAGIPISVRNSKNPESGKTVISLKDSGRPVCALAARGPVTVLSASTPRMLGGIGFLATIFDAFKRHGVAVDSVATSEVSVSISIENYDEENLESLVKELSLISTVEIKKDQAIIAVVGHRLPESPNIPRRVFACLGDIQPRMISMGFSRINLGFIVDAEQAAEAQKRLHREFFESGSGIDAGDLYPGRECA